MGEQRLDTGDLRKQPEKKEGGFQKEMPSEKNNFEQERKEIKGTTRHVNGDSYEKAREHEEVIQAKKEEEQKERKREEERKILKKQEEKRKIDQKIELEKRKERMLLEKKKEDERRKE